MTTKELIEELKAERKKASPVVLEFRLYKGIIAQLERGERLETALTWIRDTSSNPHIQNRAKEALAQGGTL